MKNAKKALDKIIRKSRIHCYKPIQVAEILYKSRTEGDFSVTDLESYRNPSKHWRDVISSRLVGNVSTSSQKFQDDLFNPHAMPPEKLDQLDKVNKSNPKIVENYIYHRLKERWGMLNSIGRYIEQAIPTDFSLREVISFFTLRRGLKKSIDKVYEISVHSLFSSIVRALRAEITLELKNPDPEILEDFKEFTSIVLGVDAKKTFIIIPARLYRMGVTHAADTGVDIGTNFGPVVQVKYISLDVEQASGIVEFSPAERIIVVCRKAEKNVIMRVAKQLGFGQRIQGIITQGDLETWYELALKKYENQIGKSLLSDLLREFHREFPMVAEIDSFLKERGYNLQQLVDEWEIVGQAGLLEFR